ncbi:MAG: hypothetical protein JXM73_04990 [Anaerolineae bacterium]|nr:hypothetical protein [Anaerolineae bacterium]
MVGEAGPVIGLDLSPAMLARAASRVHRSGLAFFWLFPLKLISRLATRLGYRSPCPAAVSWLVDNPIRRRYMRPIVDRIGIRPGQRVLELGPGLGDPDYLSVRDSAPRRGSRVPLRGALGQPVGLYGQLSKGSVT